VSASRTSRTASESPRMQPCFERLVSTSRPRLARPGPPCRVLWHRVARGHRATIARRPTLSPTSPMREHPSSRSRSARRVEALRAAAAPFRLEMPLLLENGDALRNRRPPSEDFVSEDPRSKDSAREDSACGDFRPQRSGTPRFWRGLARGMAAGGCPRTGPCGQPDRT